MTSLDLIISCGVFDIISICACSFFTPYGSLSLSNTTAVTLINSLRSWQGQGEPESHRSQSQRIVLLGKNEQRWSEKFLKANVTSHKTYKLPVLMQSTVAPLIKSQGWLKNISASQFDNTQMVSEPSVLSDNRNSFLDCYTGAKPLIGEHSNSVC